MGNYIGLEQDEPPKNIVFEGKVLDIITRKSTNSNPNGLYIKVEPINENNIFSLFDFSGKPTNKITHLILNTTNKNYNNISKVIKKDKSYHFTITPKQLYPILIDVEKC